MTKWGHLGIVLCFIASTNVWASIGKVSLLKGEAVASRNQQNVQLSTNSAIEEHDRIVTGDNSQIQLTFEDKTVITLGSSSVMDVQEYLNDAQQPKAKFKFNQGTFKSITGEIGKKAPENFNLETKTATIGIRGTTVGGVIETDHDMIACLAGAIEVGNALGKVAVSAGSFTQVGSFQPPTPPQQLTPAQIQQLNASARPSQSQTPPSPPAAPPVAPPIINDIANNVVAQSNQNLIVQSAQNAIDEQSSFVRSIGLTSGYVDYDSFKGSISEYHITTNATTSVTLLYMPYEIDYTTGEATLASSYTQLSLSNIPALQSTAWLNMSGLTPSLSGFHYLRNSEVTPPLYLNVNGTLLNVTTYELFQDDDRELFAAFLNDGSGYSQRFIIGKQSLTVPEATILYYKDLPDSYPELTGGNIALAINTANKNVLGFSLDADHELSLTLGTTDQHHNLSLNDYSLKMSLGEDSSITQFYYANLSGAIYGTSNQMIGVNGKM